MIFWTPCSGNEFQYHYSPPHSCWPWSAIHCSDSINCTGVPDHFHGFCPDLRAAEEATSWTKALNTQRYTGEIRSFKQPLLIQGLKGNYSGWWFRSINEEWASFVSLPLLLGKKVPHFSIFLLNVHITTTDWFDLIDWSKAEMMTAEMKH